MRAPALIPSSQRHNRGGVVRSAAGPGSGEPSHRCSALSLRLDALERALGCAASSTAAGPATPPAAGSLAAAAACELSGEVDALARLVGGLAERWGGEAVELAGAWARLRRQVAEAEAAGG